MEPVSSRNQHVAEAARLHRARERRETGRSLIEGPNLLSEALAGGVVPHVIFALAGDADVADVWIGGGQIPPGGYMRPISSFRG